MCIFENIQNQQASFAFLFGATFELSSLDDQFKWIDLSIDYSNNESINSSTGFMKGSSDAIAFQFKCNQKKINLIYLDASC